MPILVDKEKRLPAGWRRVRLEEVCNIVGGTTPDTGKSDYWNGDIVWITPIDLGKNSEVTISSSGRRITIDGMRSCGIDILPVDTVIMSSRAPIGYISVAGVPFCTNQGCKSFIPSPSINSLFLYWALKRAVSDIQSLGIGATFSEVSKSSLQKFEIPLPPLPEQQRIAAILNEQMAVVDKARAAAQERLEAVKALPFSLIRESLICGRRDRRQLGDCLIEVRNGVGKEWPKYPVLGATREGLALAKEPVGKTPERYKVADPVTVFYNPMRILLGSISIVDIGDETGITSPDYVVLKGREGILDTRWFYHWFRSPEGAHLINSLSRGAVRERILFNRLASISTDGYSPKDFAPQP
ncbi:MAG: hypothetical protein FJY82_11785 [Candidatus Aminicenantes bacterium]|nr:hypothetical protein [Candidatus Aminicenantes bacterium]